jgi:L-cysteine:1D-myo-inositol 2-amino-2-deoxy-alpha-D-glucopyranoside ligase
VLAEVRERLADDLDAPGALAAVDRWASAVTGTPGPASGAASGPVSGAASGPVSGAASGPVSGAASGPVSGAASGPASGAAAQAALVRDAVDGLLGVAL